MPGILHFVQAARCSAAPLHSRLGQAGKRHQGGTESGTFSDGRGG